VPSETKILRASNGVVLKRVMLLGLGGKLAEAYSVSTNRTLQVQQTNSLEEANRLFEEELSQCIAKAS
jgi:hypothetical protein